MWSGNTNGVFHENLIGNYCQILRENVENEPFLYNRDFHNQIFSHLRLRTIFI